MRFICDDNLGKLAKYLRILGFDTYFKEPVDNSELLRIAASEERFLLTRDTQLGLKSHPFGILLLENDDPSIQLQTVISGLELQVNPADLFQRCSRCNAICNEIDKSQIQNQIFPYILNTQDSIKQCPSCHRFYWKGTHYYRLLAKLRQCIPDNAIVGRWPDEF